MTKQVVGFGLAVMATLLGLVVLWQFRTVLVYVMISLLLAAALRPLVNGLVGRGRMARVAWIILYLAVLAGFGYFLFRIGDQIFEEVQQLVQTVSVQDVWKLPLWLEGSAFQQLLATRLPAPSRFFNALTGDEGQLVLPAILVFTQGVGGIVSGALIILFLMQSQGTFSDSFKMGKTGC